MRSENVEERRFDLRTIEAEAWATRHQGISYYGFMVTLAVLTLVLAAVYLAKLQSGGLTSLFLLSLIPGGLAEALEIYLVLASAHGPLEVRVSPNSVALLYRSGKRRMFDFGNRHHRLVVRGHDDPRWGARQWRVSGGLPYRSFISAESLVAILTMAQNQGCSVTERVYSGEKYITIRPAHALPHAWDAPNPQ
jgi:hypothetical protein